MTYLAAAEAKNKTVWPISLGRARRPRGIFYVASKNFSGEKAAAREAANMPGRTALTRMQSPPNSGAKDLDIPSRALTKTE